MTDKEKIEQLIKSKDKENIILGLQLAKSQKIRGLDLSEFFYLG